jgi:hypothetical protein
MIAHKKLAGDLQDGRSIVADGQGSKKSWLLRTVMDRLALFAINFLPVATLPASTPRSGLSR